MSLHFCRVDMCWNTYILNKVHLWISSAVSNTTLSTQFCCMEEISKWIHYSSGYTCTMSLIVCAKMFTWLACLTATKSYRTRWSQISRQTIQPTQSVNIAYTYWQPAITYSKVMTVTSQIGWRSTILLYNENMFSLFALYLHS